jgi:hypothetical protein
MDSGFLVFLLFRVFEEAPDRVWSETSPPYSYFFLDFV